jgi:hypothetical protein
MKAISNEELFSRCKEKETVWKERGSCDDKIGKELQRLFEPVSEKVVVQMVFSEEIEKDRFEFEEE